MVRQRPIEILPSLFARLGNPKEKEKEDDQNQDEDKDDIEKKKFLSRRINTLKVMAELFGTSSNASSNNNNPFLQNTEIARIVSEESIV
tara:strand:- start:196 stop:462 length:267 start_codon:yes stop_codon:yes gene_type:complete